MSEHLNGPRRYSSPPPDRAETKSQSERYEAGKFQRDLGRDPRPAYPSGLPGGASSAFYLHLKSGCREPPSEILPSTSTTPPLQPFTPRPPDGRRPVKSRTQASVEAIVTERVNCLTQPRPAALDSRTFCVHASEAHHGRDRLRRRFGTFVCTASPSSPLLVDHVSRRRVS